MKTPWYEKLGFSTNPFTIKPGRLDKNVIANWNISGDIDQKIKETKIVFIEGEFGSGKTTLLKSIINRYRKKNKIIYYNFNKGENFSVKEVMSNEPIRRKILRFGRKQRTMLLLDEAQDMKSSEVEDVLRNVDELKIGSAIFVSKKSDNIKISDKRTKIVKKNKIKLTSLDDKQAIELIRKRIGKIGILSDTIIITLFKLAKKNPRILLEYAEHVCKYVIDSGRKQANKEDVKAVIKDSTKEKSVKKQKSKSVKKKKVRSNPIAKKTSVKTKKIKKKGSKKTFDTIPEIVLTNEYVETTDGKMRLHMEAELDRITNKAEGTDKTKENKTKKKFKLNKLVASDHKKSLGMVSQRKKKSENDKSKKES